MLSKKNRVVKRRDIQKILNTSCVKNTKYFRLQLLPAQDFRLLIVVSKKISKRANKRNKLRRKISACIENLNIQKKLPNNCWVFIRPIHKEALELPFTYIKEQIILNLGELYSKNMAKYMVDKKAKNELNTLPSKAK